MKKCVNLNFSEFAFSDVPVEDIESGKYEVHKYYLKGLSHEMDLAFDDKYG
jgi:hypothetical protein